MAYSARGADSLAEERRFEPSVPSREGVTSSRGSEGPAVDYDGRRGPVSLGGRTEGSNLLLSGWESVSTVPSMATGATARLFADQALRRGAVTGCVPSRSAVGRPGIK